MTSSRPVYSTDRARMCPKCNRLQTACRCRKPPTSSGGDGIVRVARSTKGRKGKGVTVITGVPLAGDALKKFATQLKTACGAGGAVKDGAIEIQGDHRDKVLDLLETRGWHAKRAGG